MDSEKVSERFRNDTVRQIVPPEQLLDRLYQESERLLDRLKRQRQARRDGRMAGWFARYFSD